MANYQYRLIDTAGAEIAISGFERPRIDEGETVTLPDGSTGTVVEVYDDEDGREGGVVATLVVEEEES
jgi:hypothetical protein